MRRVLPRGGPLFRAAQMADVPPDDHDDRDRAELLARLVSVRDQLCGIRRLSIDDWLALMRDLPALEAIVARATSDSAFPVEPRHALHLAWTALAASLRKDIEPPLCRRLPPSLTLEARVYERIQKVVASLASLVKPPPALGSRTRGL